MWFGATAVRALPAAENFVPSQNKAQLVAFVRSERMRFSRYESSDLRIRTYGSTAIVSDRLERKRTISGREVDDDWRVTKVYVRGRDGWRVVAFHASEAAKPRASRGYAKVSSPRTKLPGVA